MDYAEFVVEFVVAAKAGDRARLGRVLKQTVTCTFCKKDVSAMAAWQTDKARLACPACGAEWVRF